MKDLRIIQVHDLIEIRADDGEETHGIPRGWYIVLTIIDLSSGPLVNAVPLGGSVKGTENITKRSAHLVKRVLRTTALPQVDDSLEHIGEYWNGDRSGEAVVDALVHVIETSDAAIAALRVGDAE